MTADRIRQPDIEKDFMAGVRIIRQKQKMSQADLCRLCELPQNIMTHLETGRTRLTLERAVAFQKALNTNIFDLIKIGSYHRYKLTMAGKGIVV